MASSSVSNVEMGAMGAKVSSCMQSERLADSVEDRGFEKIAAGSGELLAAADDFGAVADSVADLRESGIECLFAYERTDVYIGLEAGTGFEFFGAAGEFFEELVVDGALHVDAIGGDAGLAGVAELGDESFRDGLVKVAVLKDEQRSQAAQLKRERLDGLGCAADQLADRPRLSR